MTRPSALSFPFLLAPPPHRETLITKIFFRQILVHAASPSISISDLVTTVATHFHMSAAIVEREAETASDSIRDYIFRVTNMTGVDFLNSKGKPVAITDPSRRLDNITYFTFVLILILTSLTREHRILFIYSNFLCVFLTHSLFFSVSFRPQLHFEQ